MAWTERYVRADAAGSGDGTTDTNSGANGAWTLDEGIANAVAGHRVNVKAGTYTVSAAKSWNVANGPILWRGFNTTIGDLIDAWDSLAFPDFNSAGNYQYTIGGSGINNQWFENIKLTTTRSTTWSAAIQISGQGCQFRQCAIRQAGTASNLYAVTADSNGDGGKIFESYIQHDAATTFAVNIQALQSFTLFGNVIKGAGSSTGSGVYGARGWSFLYNIIRDFGGYGCRAEPNSAQGIFAHNTVYNVGSHGLYLGTHGDGHCSVVNNVFSNCGGYGIESSAASNAWTFIWGNLFYSCTSGTIHNIYEDRFFDLQTDSSSPFVSAGSDFSLASGSNGRFLGGPLRYMDLSGTVGYASMGSVIPQGSAGGSGGVFRHHFQLHGIGSF